MAGNIKMKYNLNKTTSLQDEECCTPTNPCDLGGGDCDADADCVGSLVCGTNNCRTYHPTDDINA